MNKIKKDDPLSFRPDTAIRNWILDVSEREDRSLSNVLNIVVGEYILFTDGDFKRLTDEDVLSSLVKGKVYNE